MAWSQRQQQVLNEILPAAQEAYKKYGVYASVTIAQAILETSLGEYNGPIVTKDHNLYGIGRHGNHDPSLVVGYGSGATDGGPSSYASYKSFADGTLDHGYFLRNNSIYAKAFRSGITPDEQIVEIMNAGYAEDRYDQKAIATMKQYNLYQYDTGKYVGTDSSGATSSEEEEEVDPLAINYDAVTERTYNKSMSYFGASVQQASTADLNAIKNGILDKYAESRHFDKAPPGYYDNVVYSHRELAYQLADETTPVPIVNGVFDLSPRDASMAVLDYDKSESDIYEYGDSNRVFRIGDCYFIIPPEFITVSTKTSNEEIQGIRQSSSTQKKNGYSRKEIQVSLILNGMDQINGYEVEGPMEYKYAMDGLRTLLSQFKYTPFVPIENTMINLIHGVYNVALRNINVETIAGFPEALQVTISMQEFNATPYTRCPNQFFDDAIDWDLFRYYVQQPLRDRDVSEYPYTLQKINKPSLTAEFQFSILTQDALDAAYEANSLEYKENNHSIDDYNMYVNVFDPDNYKEMINSTDDISLTYMSFGMGNIMPLIQLSAHESPTMQYLGCTNTKFTFGFETTSTDVAAKFNELNMQNQNLVRTNRFKNGIGFVKIDNELVQLTGCQFVLLEDVTVSTVPGFPGTFSITCTCVSYDSAQKENEKLIGMRPFDGKDEGEGTDKEKLFRGRKGTRDDLISMQSEGISNKIVQDATIQKKFQMLEMYPDLHLPKLTELDEAITKIRAYRAAHNLSEQMLFDAYPRYTCVIPGSPEEQVYEGYADPDFYVMALNTPADIEMSDNGQNVVAQMYNYDTKSAKNNLHSAVYDSSNSSVGANLGKITSMQDQLKDIESPLDLYYRPTLQPDVAIEPDYVPGYEPGILDRVHKGLLNFIGTDKKKEEDSGSVNADGTIAPGTSIQGASVTIPTQINKKTGNVFIDFLCDRADAGCGYIFGDWGQTIATSGRWAGKQTFDCSGLISWGLNIIGMMQGRTNNTGFDGMGTKISFDSLQVGDLVVRLGGTGGGHVAAYIGTNQIVEAAGKDIGVIYSTFNSSKFSYALRLTDLDKYCKAYLEKNPGIYGGSGISGISKAIASGAARVLSSTGNSTGETNTETESSSNSTTSRGGAKFNPIINYTAEQSKTSATKVESSSESKVGKADENTYGSMVNLWDEQILTASGESGLDPNFIKAVMIMESRGDKDKINGQATGLMQIFVSASINPDVTRADMLDAQKNLTYGAKMLIKLGDKYNLDIDNTLTCYIAGSDYVGSDLSTVSLGGGRTIRTAIDEVLTIYKALIGAGGNPGSQKVPTVNGEKLVSNGEDGEVVGNVVDPDKRMGEDASKFKNPNAGKKHGDKISNINISKFGLDFIEKIGEGSENKYAFDAAGIHSKIQAANDPEHVIEYMFVDHRQHSMKGTLCRAFPSYLLVFLDEQADWIDRKKLWTNYYVSRSAIDINIHEAYDSPVHTATATLTNFYSNLTHLKVSKTVKDLAFDGDANLLGGNFDGRAWLYWATGTILDEEITDKMIAYKNDLFDDIKLEEGARVHIRLGYGSNPARYPIGFNGTIAQIDAGETVTFVAQSDGTELVNQPLTDKTEDTNKDLDIGVEVSNIATNLLVARESGFLYTFTKGFFKYRSKYGIEHFGIHMNTGKELSVGSVAETGLDALFNPVFTIAGTVDNSMNYKQYDIVKNIYTGTYKGVPFCKAPYNPFDGEYNFRFFCAGKTVWDVLKMCEKAIPEFVAYPRYFNFETRLFYGLPTWLCKYKYNIDGNGLYEHAKSFAQIHEVSSLDSIIDNGISLDTRNLYTNMIGIYTLGGDLSSTPVVMSDKYIDWSKQKTKTIDTTSVQDFAWIPGFVDKLMSWTGAYDNGKQLAINCCISELMDSWKNTYTGNLLILGQPEIHVHDFIYMNDDYIGMGGMVTVREVVHSMSISSGFTSSVTPGLIANNTLKQSGISNVITSASQIVRNGCNAATLMLTAANMVSSTARTITAAKYASITAKTGKLKNFLNGPGKAAFSYIKSTKIVTKGTSFLKEIKTFSSLATKLKNFKECFTIGKTVVQCFTAAFPPALIASIAVDILLNIFFTWLYDMFAYDNTICLNPLVTRTTDGKTIAYVGNKRGQRTLLPNFTDAGSKNDESDID